MSPALIALFAGTHSLAAVVGIALTLWRNRGQVANVEKEAGDVYADFLALNVKTPADLLKLLGNPAALKKLATDAGEAIDAIRELIARVKPAPSPAHLAITAAEPLLLDRYAAAPAVPDPDFVAKVTEALMRDNYLYPKVTSTTLAAEAPKS